VSAGNYQLDFYCVAPGGTREMGVFVNGDKIGVLSVSILRYNWTAFRFSASLVSGANTIELRDTEGESEPDVDYIVITPE